MNVFKYGFKLIVQIIFVIIFFSTLHAKNPDKFNEGNYISDYFSGILLLNDNQYDESYKFFKRLEGLEKSHLSYSSRYLFSLINLGKFNEAFNYSKTLEKSKSSNYESNLIIGVHYLKDKNYNLAQQYFLKIQNRKLTSVVNEFVINSLLNWSSFNDLSFKDAQKRINEIDSRFENLKSIQNVFLHCFYESKKTKFLFQNLVKNKKIDFSRYSYFYAKYLSDSGQVNTAKEILDNSIKLHPRNLLLNQYMIDLNNNTHENNFNCQNPADVVAEILYIAANALSSQNLYKYSNFYLNLSKYLNSNFESNKTLLAENFYKLEDFEEARKIYNIIQKKGDAFFWYTAKQNAKIFIKEEKKKKAIKVLTIAYEKLSEKTVYQKFDYANFLKNNEKYERSIKLFTDIIESIKIDHPLYPKATEGRGIAYERINKWEKAEKDLLKSLEVSPDQAYVINYLAYSWIEQGVKIEESLKMLERANNLESNDPYIIDSLGWALFKLERYLDAKNYLQMAVKLLPADPIVNDHYGDVLWKNGNRIQARYYWNYVLNLEETEKDLKKNIKKKLISGL